MLFLELCLLLILFELGCRSNYVQIRIQQDNDDKKNKRKNRLTTATTTTTKAYIDERQRLCSKQETDLLISDLLLDTTLNIAPSLNLD